MTWLLRYLRSSIGAKQTMAVTGLVLWLFALQHMTSHLQMFGGRDLYNGYADWAQNLWEVKWPLRALLLACLFIHLVAGIVVSMRNRAARPAGYAVFRPVVTSAAARTMIWTGVIVFVFLTFHILQFTVGAVEARHFHVLDWKHRWDSYGMYVAAFQRPSIFVVYLIGMALLCFHLGHGAASWLQTLGWRHPKYPLDKLGRLVGWVLFVGYLLPPTAVLCGVIS